MNIVFSNHAKFEMERRQISEKTVSDVVINYQQTIQQGNDRTIYQSKYREPDIQKEMLLRVVCEEYHNTITVVTAYKTSKIEKYWAWEV